MPPAIIENPAMPEAAAPAGARLRLAMVIFLTQIVSIWWIVDSEVARDVYLICYSLMMPTVLYLLLTRLLRKWLPLTDRELLLGYIVLTATLPILGFGGLRFIVEGQGYLSFFSQSQPQWVKYLPYVQKLPVLKDAGAIRDLYQGGGQVPWKAWIVPISFWSLYLCALSGVWISLAAVLRRIWINQERLTFPIAVLPLQIYSQRDNIVSGKLFWYGFAIPAIAQSLLALHYWFPNVPAAQLKASNYASVIFTSPPWNAIPDLQIGLYPMAIGLAYLVPSGVSFSCWFFWIMMRLTYVGGAIFGIQAGGPGMGQFPFREQQAVGAWLTFAAMAVYGGARHWRSARNSIDKSEQAATRYLVMVALALLALCVAMMSLTGIPLVFSLCVVAVYTANLITGARVRAEAGGQWTFAPAFWTPNRVMNAALGTQMPAQGMVSAAHFDLIHNDIRGQSLPYLMEGLFIAEKSRIAWRTTLIWVAAGTVTALAIGWWFSLTDLYQIGAATARANDYPLMRITRSMTEMERAFTHPEPWDKAGMAAVAFGCAVTLALSWWHRLGVLGLHPAGYVLCNTFTMSSFFLPFFIAWSAKTVILRFFGYVVYRRSIPFFLGIALGDMVTQALWALIGALFHTPVYQFLT